MRTQVDRAIATGLEGTRRRFERWRRNRRGRSRIPKTLWSAAVRAAAKHGLCRTAQTLGLDYTALKRHVGVADSAVSLPSKGGIHFDSIPDGTCGGVHEPTATGEATFVEWPAIASGGGCECVLEWQDSGGARMRVHLTGAQPGHLAAMVGRLGGATA